MLVRSFSRLLTISIVAICVVGLLPAQASAVIRRVDSVNFWDSQHGVVSGTWRDPTGYGFVSVTADGGNTFRPYWIQPEYSSTGDARMVSETTAAAVALFDRRIYYTGDSGATWDSMYTSGDNGVDLQSLAFNRSGRGWVVGQRVGGQNGMVGVVYGSTDSGSSWARQFEGPKYPQQVDFNGNLYTPQTNLKLTDVEATSTVAYAFGKEIDKDNTSVQYRRVYKSVNGSAWTTCSIGPDTLITAYDLSVPSASIVWLAADGRRAYYSSNGGGSFATSIEGRVSYSGSLLNWDAVGVHAFDANNAFMAANVTNGYGIVLKTTTGYGGFDGGKATATPILNLSGTTLTGIHFSDRNNGWVTGENGVMYKTSDGGVTWVNRSDSAAPVLTISSPLANFNPKIPAVLVSGSVTDDRLGVIGTEVCIQRSDGALWSGVSWTSAVTSTSPTVWHDATLGASGTTWDYVWTPDATVFAGNFTYRIGARGVDALGRITAANTRPLVTSADGPTGGDGVAPVVTCDPDATYLNSAAIAASAVDPATGVSSISYRLDSEPTVTVTASSTTVRTTSLGAHTLKVWASDYDGNVSTPITRTFEVLDGVAPVVSCLSDLTYSGTASISASAVDTGTGVASISYRLDDETTVTAPGSSATTMTTSIVGDHTLRIWAEDAQGNISTPIVRTFEVLEIVAPLVTCTTNPTYTNSALVSASAVDTGTGVAWMKYRFDGATTVTVAATSFSVNTSQLGDHELVVWAADALGNTSTPITRTFEVLDGTAPVVTCDPLASYRGSASIGASAVDTGTGVASISYRLDSATTVTVAAASSTISTSAAGDHTLLVWATDSTGNISAPLTREFTVVEGDAPVVTCDPLATYLNHAAVPVSAVDVGSGVASISYRLDSAATVTVAAASTTVTTTAIGEHTLRVIATDSVGNVSAPITRTFEVLDGVAPVVTCNPAETYSGSAAVSVSAVDTGSALASVSYRLDDAATVTVAAASTTVNTSVLGAHTLRVWAADSANNTSTPLIRAFTVTAPVITEVSTTLGISAVTPVTYGGATTVRVTLKDAGGTPLAVSRSVRIEYRASSTAAWSLAGTVTGSGTLSLSRKPPYKTTYYRATFAGDAAGANPRYLSSTSSVVAVSRRAYLTTPVTPSRAYRNRAFTVYGYLRPRHTTGTYPVTLYCYRIESGRMVLRKRIKAKALYYNSSTTKYSVAVSLPYAGSWRIKAYHPADTVHVATYTGYRSLTVK